MGPIQFTDELRREVTERIDIFEVSQKQSTPGSSIPESVVQTGVEALFEERSENTRTTARNYREFAPGISQNIVYTCYIFDSPAPAVSQIIKRADGERLTIMTKPQTYKNVSWFDCQHTS